MGLGYLLHDDMISWLTNWIKTIKNNFGNQVSPVAKPKRQTLVILIFTNVKVCIFSVFYNI